MHTDLRAAAEWLERWGASPRPEELLADELYVWYLNATPLPEPSGSILPFECSLPAALRAAHAAQSRFEGGWRIQAVSSQGRIVAASGELTRILDRGEYLSGRKAGRPVRPGEALMVRALWDWVDENGFWHTRRGSWPPPGADRLVRTYWNCPPRTLGPLLAELTRALEADRDIPYMLKTAARSDHGGRADALILYLGPDGFARLEQELRRIANRPELDLRPERPRFTFPVASGVGLAEGRIDGDSFGQVRCRAATECFLGLSSPDRRRADAIAAALVDGFRARDLDPERPHLEPEPDRDYGC